LLSPEEIQDSCKVTRRFFEKFLMKGDAILTFNQDILLEQSLWENGKWTPLDGYSISSRLIYRPDLARNLKKELKGLNRTSSEHYVLKLHGSINWDVSKRSNYCRVNIYPGNFPPLLEGRFKETIYLEGGASPEEGILAPTYLKRVDYLVLTAIWEAAAHYVEKAQQLYFIGYSLPQADYLAEFLFVSSLRKNKNIEKITVVNPGKKDLRRFENFFKRDLHYEARGTNMGKRDPYFEPIKKTFEEWAEAII
jgi:hypothetical protein